MIRDVGLWIDHRKAVIVTIVHPDDGTRLLQANLERKVLFPESAYTDGSAHNLGDGKFGDLLNSYYGDVVACIRDAEAIQIFGPGEATHQLEKRLRHEKLGGRIVGIEIVEKMTERQIEAKVWQHVLAYKS